MKILVIEDDLFLLRSLELMLKKHGYDVITASLGNEAIKNIILENPDLILLDMYLPDISGIEIMKELQKKDLTLNIIVMTAHSSEEIAIQSLRYGAKDFILKPVNSQELLQRIEKIFREINLKKEEDRLIKEKEILLEQMKSVQDMKNKFMDMIVHNLKNPLSSVLGFASVMATRELSTKEKMEYYKIIEEQGKRMLIMLDDLLRDSFYKEGKIPLKCTVFNTQELLKNNLSNIEIKAKDKSISFYLNMDDDGRINADKDKLIQVVENLLDNSFKFTPEEGEIKLKICGNKDEILISVSDTGIGIPKNMVDKVFLGSPLISRKGLRSERGTGLGLAYCKKIIELHGGRIELNSDECKGTDIVISIPRNISEPAE